MQQSFKNMAHRAVTAENNFAECVMQVIGCTQEEAFKVLAVYRKAKAVKNDYAVSRIVVKHGAFWNADVLRRALAAG